METIYNPFAGKTHSGSWLGGSTDLRYLKSKFGHLNSIEEMKNESDSEGLRLFFDYLNDSGNLHLILN